MKLTFQLATPDEAAEIIRVKADAFADEVKLYGHGPTLASSVESEQDLIRNRFYYLLKDGTDIVGAICVAKQGEGLYHIGPFYIRMADQNKGYGQIAMRYVEEQFPDAQKWTLDTPYLSYRNHYFYEKCGYIKVGQTEPDLTRNGFILFQYEKIL